MAQANPDRKVDVGALMAVAMENQVHNTVSPRARHIAYGISLAFPPIGLFFAVYYWWWSDKEDAHHLALMCIGLTVFIVAITLLFLQILITNIATPQQLQDIQNVNIQQIQQELQ